MSSRKINKLESKYGVKIKNLQGYNYQVQFDLDNFTVNTFEPVRLKEIEYLLTKYVKEIK